MLGYILMALAVEVESHWRTKSGFGATLVIYIYLSIYIRVVHINNL